MDTRQQEDQSVASVVTVLVLTASDAFENAVTRQLPQAGFRVMRAESADRAVELAGAGVDIAVVDATLAASSSPSATKALRAGLGGFMIVCPGDDAAAMRAETVAGLSAVECADMSPESGELAAQVERLAAVRAHRRELEECEQGERDCTLRKPRLVRKFSRRRKFMLLIAAAVIVITGIAVPWVVVSLRAARAKVESGVDVTNEAINAIHRMEGYLQRDEERKEQRGK